MERFGLGSLFVRTRVAWVAACVMYSGSRGFSVCRCRHGLAPFVEAMSTPAKRAGWWLCRSSLLC